MFKKLYSISEVTKILNLKSKYNKKTPTYILRFWEKKFSQIKPKKINNNRRYYTIEQIEKLKFIKYLLKDKGLTIKGAKNLLQKRLNKLDDNQTSSISSDYYKKNFKTKTIKILEKLTKLKNRNG